MKKIFTLLYCIAGITFAANANDDAPIEQCINMVLNGTTNSTALTSPNMDVNHDGIIDITDVTLLIDQKLRNEKANRAPAVKNDTEEMTNRLLEGTQPAVSIKELTDAIEENLNR